MTTNNKKLIIVLGMHRSGTSVITRGLQVMGVELGDKMMPPVEGNNAKGFYEDIDLNALNIEMLNTIESDWHHVAAVDSTDVEILRKKGHFLHAVELLRQRVSSARVFGFKDPRVAKLLPFWKEVISHCQLDVSYVLAVRNPLSVAKSLAKRDSIEAEQAYLMWLAHVLASLTGSAGAMRVLVDYDRLMQSPDHELNRMAKHLDLEIDPTELQSYKTEFLDQKLRHTVYELNDLLLDDTCPPIVREIYAALLDVVSDKAKIDDAELQKKVVRWSDEFERLKSPLLLIDRLITQKQSVAERDRQIAGLAQVVHDKEVHIGNLDQAMSERDGQIAGLAQVVHDKEIHIGNLNQAMSERDGQIAGLAQVVHDKEIHIGNLNQAMTSLTEKNQRLSSELSGMLASASWKLTAPLRRGKAFLRRVYRFFMWRPHRMRMEPANDLVLQAGVYHSTGTDPQFRLESNRTFLPCGWCHISYVAYSEEKPLIPVLYFDVGEGVSDEHKLHLPASANGGATMLAKLPSHIRALRLDPTDVPCEFSFSDLTITEVGKAEAAFMLAWPFFKRILGKPSNFFPLLGKAISLLRTGGTAAFKHKLVAKNQAADYQMWIALYDTLTEQSRAAMRSHIDSLTYRPLISVVMPTYNPKPEWLIEAIESIRKQIYPHWELCIADDASTDKAVRTILERYAKEDARIKFVIRKKNGHISAASNSALKLATGEWVALLDHDDLLSEHALFWVADTINQHPDARLIYSDEDKVDEFCGRFDPYFKCDWNVDLFLSHNMFSHLGIYRADLLSHIGGFREGMEGSQDYDLALRCIEQIEPNQIIHIPRVLYHWRMHAESTAQSADAKPYAMLAGERAINEHFQRCGVAAKAELIGYGYRVRYALPDVLPMVSLIIPTRNGLQLIQQCIQSVLEKTTYPNYEIVIVDNGSDDPATLDYFKELVSEPRIHILRDARPFNYSALNNAAVKLARGELLALLNNDIEVISPDWLSEMVSHALRPGIGAVGAQLWYPGETLQHGGVILGLGASRVAGHAHHQMPKGHHGYFGRASLISSFSAVSAACLVIRKAIYKEIGGLNETDLHIAFNDVDFCLRVREAGYRNLWTPFAELYHHESATRGIEDTPEKQARFAKEVAYMNRRWGDQLLNDPAYSPNLTLEHANFSLAWPPRTAPLTHRKSSPV